MAVDPQGRLFVSCQATPPGAGMTKEDKWGGLFRVTLDDRGQVAKWEQVPVPVGDAMGMLLGVRLPLRERPGARRTRHLPG